MSTSLLPPGWTRTRVLITGYGWEFTVPLRNPIDNVVHAHVVSIQGAACILQVEGLNYYKMSTLTDDGTRVYHHDYLGNNLSYQLAYATVSPALPSHVSGHRTITELKVTLINADGSLFNTMPPDAPVNIEIDLFCFRRP